MNNYQKGIIAGKTFLALITGAILFSCGTKEQQQAAPPDIPVVEVVQQDVPLHQEFVGQILGEVDIPIRARVSGWLEGIHFQEGSPVKKGQLLYTIDQQEFLAQVQVQESRLAEAKTAFVKAEADLNRYKPLAEKNAVSKSDLDAAQASYDAALAYVDAAEAGVDIAKIDLSYCNIKAPIDGIIGKTKAKVGEFVGQNPNPVILNTVSSIDKVRVEFFLTESDYLILARKFKDIDNQPEQTRDKATLRLILSDGTIHPSPGKVDFINREVDQETGSLLVQASFDNPEGILRPGQFARVDVQMLKMEDALILPQKCFMELQGVYSVATVNAENEIVTKRVKVGPMYKDFRIVLEGLEPGEKVVLEGLQKVRPGMKVNPVPTLYESKYSDELNK